MMYPKFTRWGVAAGLLAATGPAVGQNPAGTPATPATPAEVVWKRPGQMDLPPAEAPAGPVVPTSAKTGPVPAVPLPAPAPAAPAPLPALPPIPMEAAGDPVPLPATAVPAALPRRNGYVDPTHPVGPRDAGPPAADAAASQPEPVPDAARPPAVTPTRGEPPVAVPFGRPRAVTPAVFQPPPMPDAVPGSPAPMTGMPMGSSAQPGTTTQNPAGVLQGGGPFGGQAGGDAKPVTWHGHKHPILPFAPPGAAPIAPAGPGYYTLLAMVQGEEQQKPPRWPYPRFGLMPPSFHEVDFSYLDPIPFGQRDWAEKLKRVPVGESWLFSTGGDLRTRYNYETNSRLSGRNNVYQLFRGRAFADLWYEDVFRVYGEFLYGDSIWHDLPPLSRDVNRGDLQALFADVKVWGGDGSSAYTRLGRQELIYGSQRLISTNEWGNNRTRFQGVKGFYRSAKLDADVFLTQPVVNNFNGFDSVDNNQVFSGAWATYKPKKGTFLDAYYLNLDNTNPNVARGRGRSGAFNLSTLGSRYYSRFDSGFLVDLEGALQFGGWADQSVWSQMASTYLGWHFKDAWATPTVWVGYDYASGDPDPNRTGTHRTFHPLFGFGHYYFGFADLVGRANIHDVTVQAYAYPAKWVTTGIQYHVFRLDSDRDALYNAFNQPSRRDPTGLSGNEVGSEIDLLVNFHLTDRQDVFVSYSRFFPGRFIQRTGPSFDGDYVYAQYTWRW